MLCHFGEWCLHGRGSISMLCCLREWCLHRCGAVGMMGDFSEWCRDARVVFTWWIVYLDEWCAHLNVLVPVRIELSVNVDER